MSDDPQDDGGEGAASGPGLLLKTEFLEALRADFAVHGADVIAACRADDPLQYIKLIASLLPKDAPARKADDAPARADYMNLSDDELLARIRSLEAAIDATTSHTLAADEALVGGPDARAGGAQAAGGGAQAAVLPALR